mmetsp:Transcript_43961/g.76556  ORF Transcript_43961/g.76556 Transcript_43961/m.76556 type:complete len:357 (-) Transcript_43961:997-2067(-)
MQLSFCNSLLTTNFTFTPFLFLNSTPISLTNFLPIMDITLYSPHHLQEEHVVRVRIARAHIADVLQVRSVSARRQQVLAALGGPVRVIGGGGIGNRAVAATVQEGGPVGQQLQLGHLKANLVVEQCVAAGLGGALDGSVGVQVELVQVRGGDHRVDHEARADVHHLASGALLRHQTGVVSLGADHHCNLDGVLGVPLQGHGLTDLWKFISEHRVVLALTDTVAVDHNGLRHALVVALAEAGQQTAHRVGQVAHHILATALRRDVRDVLGRRAVHGADHSSHRLAISPRLRMRHIDANEHAGLVEDPGQGGWRGLKGLACCSLLFGLEARLQRVVGAAQLGVDFDHQIGVDTAGVLG